MLATVRKDVMTHWTPIRYLVSVPKTDEQCERMIDLLNELLDEVGDNECHPLFSFVETLSVLIERYEDQTMPEPKTTPASVLKFLMAENQITADDLGELGSEDVISALVNGTREFDVPQIKYLCSRFHVHSDLFLGFA